MTAANEPLFDAGDKVIALNTCREMLRTVLRQGDLLARQLTKQCTCHKHGCESCTAVDRWRKWWPG